MFCIQKPWDRAQVLHGPQSTGWVGLSHQKEKKKKTDLGVSFDVREKKDFRNI